MPLRVKELAVILIIIGFIAYLPSLFGGFVWDDEDFVTKNTYVQQLQIGRFFTENAVAGRGKVSDYYRPVQFTLYSLIYGVAGLAPFAFHLAGIILHLAAGTVIFLTLVYFISPLPAFLATLFFLIHPIQTESVSYISGLSDQLYSLFFFGSLLAFLKRRHPGWSAATLVSLGLFILSMLSKELGIILPGILLFIVLLKTKTLKKDAGVLLVFFAAAAAYLTLRLTVLHFTDISRSWQPVWTDHFSYRLATFFRNFFVYLGLIVYPASLYMERDFTIPIIKSIFSVWTFLYLGVNAAVIGFLYAKRRVKQYAAALLFYILFAASFVPYTGVFLLNGIFYEHYLYLPLAFFSAFLMSLLAPYLKHRAVLYALGAVAVIFIGRSYVRQWDWIDSERFYRQTLSHAPKSLRILNGLGIALAEKGNCPEAIRTYQQAIKLNPAIPNPYHNIANCYADMGRFEDAEIYYRKALNINPNFQFSSIMLLNLYLNTNQKGKAKAMLEKELIPRFPQDERLKAIDAQLQ